MANWTNTSRAYLGGTITSYMTLDATNAGAGSIPSSWNTYNDGTYSDANYTPTAIFNGQVDTGIGRPRMIITQTGGSGDIKYKFRTSPTGSVWGSWNTLTSTYGLEYIDANDRWVDLEIVFYSPLWSDGDYFGIQTIGAQFIRFQKYSTIYAEEMNSNFNYLGGNRLPYGGLYLLPTTGVYNLGEDIYPWNIIYCNDITATTFQDDSGARFYRYISGAILSSTATKIELSGLNLDNYYSIDVNIGIVFPTAATTDYYMIFNGDSASGNYGYQNMTFNTSGSYSRNTSTGIYIMSQGTITSNVVLNINTKTGNVRTVNVFASIGYGNPDGSGRLYGYVWNNTSSTITSITLYGATASMLDVNSYIKLYGRS